MTIDKTTGQTEETTTNTTENTKTTAMNAAHWAQMLGDCTLGETLALEGLQIFPLHRAPAKPDNLDSEAGTGNGENGSAHTAQEKAYTLADDLLAKKQAEIREVDQDGVVSDLIFDNQADKHALLLDGIELRGCKQNRMVNTTILATAGEKTTVDVSCVEAGRWQHQGETFSHSGRTVGATLRNRKAHMVHAAPSEPELRDAPDLADGPDGFTTEHRSDVPGGTAASEQASREQTEAERLTRHYDRRARHRRTGSPREFMHQEPGRARTNQAAVWNEVDQYIQSHGAQSATSALDDVYESVAREDADAGKRSGERAGERATARAAAQEKVEVRLQEMEASGAIVALGNRIIGLDLFADSATFGGFWKSVADGYALDARSHARSQARSQARSRQQSEAQDRSPEQKQQADNASEPDSTEADSSEATVSREQVEAWTSFLKTGIELAPRELAGAGEHFSLQGPGVAGGLVLLEGELVHAALFPALS